MGARWAVVVGVELAGPAVVLGQAVTPEIVGAWSEIGFTGALIVTVLAFVRGWIVTGATLTKIEQTCATKVEKLEAKVDAAAALATKQSEAQAVTIASLNAALNRLDAQRSRGEG